MTPSEKDMRERVQRAADEPCKMVGGMTFCEVREADLNWLLAALQSAEQERDKLAEDLAELGMEADTLKAERDKLAEEVERLHRGLRERGLYLPDEDSVTGALNSLDEWMGYARRDAAKLSSLERRSGNVAGLVEADRNAPLTEDWLRDQGFKWTKQERQTWKHWSLYLGWASGQKNACMEDLIVEVTMAWWPNARGEPVGDTEAWNCWLRGMNNSLLHVRYIKTRDDLLGLIEALTGRPWDRSLSAFGNLYHEGHREWLEQSSTALSAFTPTEEG